MTRKIVLAIGLLASTACHLSIAEEITIASNEIRNLGIEVAAPEVAREIAAIEATARVVRSGGSLVVVANHPAYTSGGAGPVIDQSDGEVLWRWGSYMVDSISAEPAGTGSVVFHHRSIGSLLTTAARAGWDLRHVSEAGASDETIERVPSLHGQEHMPRLMGLRWSRRED